jgi:predicted transcriptional regulator
MKSKQLTQDRVAQLAAEAAANVVSTGACGAERHNTQTIATAINAALEEFQIVNDAVAGEFADDVLARRVIALCIFNGQEYHDITIRELINKAKL